MSSATDTGAPATGSPDTRSPDAVSAGTGRARRVATAAAWVTTGALAATGLTGVAFAAGTTTGAPSATATPTGAPVAGAANGQHRGLLRSVLHGTFTVQGASGPTEVTLQRGTVTSASATSVTVASTDGFSATYAITSSTLVKRDRATVTADKVVVGDSAVVRASGSTATVVRDLSPAAVAKARARTSQHG